MFAFGFHPLQPTNIATTVPSKAEGVTAKANAARATAASCLTHTDSQTHAVTATINIDIE